MAENGKSRGIFVIVAVTSILIAITVYYILANEIISGALFGCAALVITIFNIISLKKIDKVQLNSNIPSEEKGKVILKEIFNIKSFGIFFIATLIGVVGIVAYFINTI